MDEVKRYLLGFALLLVFQILLGGTVVYLVRRWKSGQSVWSWTYTLWVYFLLGLLVTAVAFVPLVGRFAAVIVSLVGLKRLSGLDVLTTFILSFFVGMSVIAMSYVLSHQLQVDLIDFGH